MSVPFLYSYKSTFESLKGLKTEIEHLQHLLQKSKIKLQRDFQEWWDQQATRLQVQQHFNYGTKRNFSIAEPNCMCPNSKIRIARVICCAVCKWFMLLRCLSDPMWFAFIILFSNI